MNPFRTQFLVRLLLPALMPIQTLAAGFTNQACLGITDPTGGLSWNTNTAALSVSCWLKISVPSGVMIAENMTVLANRRAGTESDPHAYLIQFKTSTATVDFSCKGAQGVFASTLIDRPYLDRWYHVAVVRQQEEFTGYVDGRQVFKTTASVGDAASTDGVSIGGWNSANYYYGEIQEVCIHQTALSQDFIVQNMFKDQPPIPSLKGYYRLAYSTNTADSLRNLAPAPVPTGTESAVKQGPATVEFEEANQAGEQSYFDAQRNGARDFLVPLSGAFSLNQTALSRSTPGITFELLVGYSSANIPGGSKLGGNDPYSAGPMGKGWRHVFETRVLPAQTFSPLADIDTVGLMSWDGSIETWDKDTANTNTSVMAYLTRSKAYRGELVISSTNCQWTTPERLVYVFRRPDSGDPVMRGRLTAIRDFNGNSVQINCDEVLGQITNVVDTAGGRYEFFHTNNLLGKITFGDWSVNLVYDATNRLVSISKTNASGLYAPVNTTWQFAYNSTNSLLERVIDPRGNTQISVVYDKYNRRIEQRDALNRLTRTEYDQPAKRQIRNTDAEGNVWIETYDRKHRLLSRKDPLGNETKTTYDEAGNPATITEPLGYVTQMAYDNRANVTNIVDGLANVSRRVIHPFFNKGVQEIDPLGWTNQIVIDDVTGNLLRNYDALGNLASYTYRPNGQVETVTDGNGCVSRFAYDTNGFLIAQTDAASNTTSYAVNELGWKLAQTNALGQVTTFSYDLNGKVVKTVDPLARTIVQTYDPIGNVLSGSDAKGQLTLYAYDAANQRTQMVDRAGSVWRYTYTPRGQPVTTTDPLGFSSTNSYDAANRLVAVSDALGNTVRSYYDANGKITNTVDQVGQSWRKTYDALGRVVAETDPQGDTKTTGYDAANRVKQITSPNGYPSTHEYDGRARLTQWTDPEGFEWHYQYDGVQNIVDITDALGGHYVMAYGPRNERLLERNQDGFEWRYEHDELLRLKRQTDPNGTIRTLTYDAGGRVVEVNFSTGRVSAFQYDDNNNPEVTSRSGSGPATITSFKYDALDRVTETTDAFGKKVRFGYDARGMRTSLTYPDGKVLSNTFDAVGRLTAQADWAGRQMTYAYDKAGRLVRRTYPNGVAQTNLFDTSGQLTTLSYAPSTVSSNSVNIALAYAYDRNGNKTGSSEQGTLRWPQPTLTDEKARFTASGRLIDRQIENTVSNEIATIEYRYDASGNMTNAVGAGQSWTLSYDEDNQTTSIDWDSGLTSKHIVNRYDVLGRRVARTADEIENRYVLDLAGGMERTLCDVNGAGAITAWYVHGPDLAYKIDTASNLTCYHADAMANIIALSDSAGNTVAQYAYTPYGRVLGSTNLQPHISNPYLFVGSQGVMEELPSLYFMRARYYSAEAAVFLSTDPVKKVGPGWQPVAYTYADGNPFSFSDPSGLLAECSMPFTKNEYDFWFLEGYGGIGERGACRCHDAYIEGNIPNGRVYGFPENQIWAPLDNRGQPNKATALFWHVAGENARAIMKNPAQLVHTIIHDSFELAEYFNDLNLSFGGRVMGILAGFGVVDQRTVERYSTITQGLGIASKLNELVKGVTPTAQRSARAVQAISHANVANAVQGAVGKLATQAVSLAAPFVGSFAADAFGRVLPKSTPPVLREAAKLAVAKAATAVVQVAAPYVGAAVGAVVGAAVGATAAVAAGAAAAGKAIIQVVFAVFGVPKQLIALLGFIVSGALLQYWRYRCRGSPRRGCISAVMVPLHT